MASNSGRALLVVAVVVLGALAAMALGLRLAYSAYSSSERSRTATAAAAARSTLLTYDELRPGDCITGSNLGLDNNNPWPESVTGVPCNQRHLAEIIFVGNLWPASLTKYPGDNAVTNTVDDRCQSTLDAYAGQSNPALTFDSIAPYASDWASGDRWVVCIAYEPDMTLRHSVKVSRR